MGKQDPFLGRTGLQAQGDGQMSFSYPRWANQQDIFGSIQKTELAANKRVQGVSVHPLGAGIAILVQDAEVK